MAILAFVYAPFLARLKSCPSRHLYAAQPIPESGIQCGDLVPVCSGQATLLNFRRISLLLRREQLQMQMNSAGPSSSPTKVFWGEIAPNDHIAHFYDEDETFLTTLAGYIAEGLAKRESVIIIATPQHLSRLAHLLGSNGVDLMRPLAEDRYIALDASVALSCFMVDEWPNEEMLASLVGYLTKRASKNGRRIRTFCETSALLWAAGNRTATARLEQLWSQYCRDYGFCLLCSYPKTGFTNEPAQSVAEICGHHTKFLGHDEQSWPVPAGEAA
jgi:hypothetical protein